MNKKKIKKNPKKVLTNVCSHAIIKVQKRDMKGNTNMNKYNLNRIERHYMTEVMLTFEDKHGREMTAEEFAQAVEKMRKKA